MPEQPHSTDALITCTVPSVELRASGSATVTVQTLAEQMTLVIQTVIYPGAKTHEGVLVESVGIAWREFMRLCADDPHIFHKIDARKWEEIIAAAYKAYGFDEVTLTPRSGDLGRDVIAVKKGFGAVRFLDQVKAYGPGHLVKADDVRAMLGVITGDQNTSKGVVTTTSDFAPKIRDDPLIKPYLPYRLELVNGTELTKRLSKLTGGT